LKINSSDELSLDNYLITPSSKMYYLRNSDGYITEFNVYSTRAR